MLSQRRPPLYSSLCGTRQATIMLRFTCACPSPSPAGSPASPGHLSWSVLSLPPFLSSGPARRRGNYGRGKVQKKKRQISSPFLVVRWCSRCKHLQDYKATIWSIDSRNAFPVHLVKVCVSSQILLFVFENHALNHVICAVSISGILIVIAMVTQSESKFLRSQEIKILIFIYRHIFFRSFQRNILGHLNIKIC